MGLPTPGTNNLQVLRAVEDGWQAFCRAPWAFLLFQALVLVVMAPFAALLVAGAVRLNVSTSPQTFFTEDRAGKPHRLRHGDVVADAGARD